MERPRVAVVIVTWNRWADTADCVAALRATGYAPLHIIVVDNGSTEQAGAALLAGWPAVELLRSPRNQGFAAGANLGIARALADGAPYIMTLNNDALVDAGCLAALVAAAEAQPACGIIGPKILYRDDPARIWFAGGARGRWSLSTYGWGRGARDGAAFDRARPVSYLCAGAMLVHRTLFLRVGCFDPGYFMYYEDCELCLRACAAGYTLWYEPTARVYHTVAASSGGEGSPLERYFRTVSVFRFLTRNSRGAHRAALRALRVVLLLLQILQALLCRQWPLLRALGAGLWDGLAGRARGAAACESF